MKKDFKFSIRIRENKKLLVEEVVTFGTDKYPFPNDWKNSGVAIRALEDYKNSMIENHFEISYEEPDESQEEKMEKIYFEDECKEIAWKAYMSRTDEREFEMIHRKSARDEFEKWWIKNGK